MGAFDKLFEIEQQRQAEKAADKQRREALAKAVSDRQQAVQNDWLRQTMSRLGIQCEIVDTCAIVEGIKFVLVAAGHGYPYPLISPRTGNLKPESVDDYRVTEFNQAYFELYITNTELPEEYRGRHPKSNELYARSTECLQVRGGFDNTIFTSEVARVIRELRKSAEDAPMNKALIEARWAEQEAKWAEEKRQEDIEREERQKAWQAEQAEREQARKEHNEREAALRAEVAAKFGVSADAFNYLIEQLVDELARRRQDTLEYVNEY